MARKKSDLPKKEDNSIYDGPSLQIVYTPPVFVSACVSAFTDGLGFSYDFAASEPNVCDCFFTEEMDSLSLDWASLFEPDTQPGWLNPPFSLSDKFLKKCDQEARQGAKIVSLVQAAVGSNYWHDLVWGNPYARVILLKGRIPFIVPEWVQELQRAKAEAEGKIFRDYNGNGSKNDCAVIHWDPSHCHLEPGRHMLTWDWRNPCSVPQEMSWAWSYHCRLEEKSDEQGS